jgi:hypothetical protein
VRRDPGRGAQGLDATAHGRVTPVTIPEHTWRSAARQPELALFGEVLAPGVATPPILEVSHSVADAVTDRKIQNGGHDGYVDQQY